MEKKQRGKLKVQQGRMIKKKKGCYCKTLVTKFLNYIAYFPSMYPIFDEYRNVQSVENWGSEFEGIRAYIYIYLYDRYAGYFNIYIRRHWLRE